MHPFHKPNIHSLLPNIDPSLPQKPNIVLIITDQERYPMHWPEGWTDEHLPQRKQLADTGITFTHGHTITNMCSPSRASLLTGVYPSRHGVYETLSFSGEYTDREREFPADLPNLATILKSAGYQIAYKGKWHLTKPRRGNYDWSKEDNQYVAEQFGFDGWECPDAGGTREIRDSGGSDENPMWDEAYTQQAEKFLAEVDPTQPFCLIVSLVNPHDVLLHPNNYEVLGPRERFANLGIDLPPNAKQRTDNLPKAVQSNIERATKFLGALDTEQLQIDNCNWYAWLHILTELYIGRVIDALEQRVVDANGTTLRDTTLITRVSDHGDMCMSHGGMRQKPFNIYDEVLRVPMVFSNPHLFPKPLETDAFAGLIDVVPTLAQIADADVSSINFDGLDLSPVLAEPNESVRDEIYFTYDDQHTAAGAFLQTAPQPNHIRCIRDREWKFGMYFDPNGEEPNEYELYDLNADPLEMNNVAEEAEYSEDRAALQQRLDQLMEQFESRPADLPDIFGPKAA